MTYAFNHTRSLADGECLSQDLDSDHAYLVRLGERLRARRKKLGVCQEGLATAADLSVRYLSYIEAGRGNPTILYLRRVAYALELLPEQLLEGLEHTSQDEE